MQKNQNMKKSKCCSTKAYKQETGNYFCSHCISVCETKSSFKPLFLLFTGVILLLSINCYAPNNNTKKQYPKYYIDTSDVFILSDKKVFDELLKEDVLFPEYALKSAIYETGHWKSNICLKGNNIFGITYVKSKYQIGCIKGQDNLKFGIYKSINDCIKHYKQIQKYYSTNIDEKYSDNKKYTNTLKLIDN